MVLGFQPHDIPVLVKGGLLKPLGGGTKNSVKYFAAVEIGSFRIDRKWLDRATRVISRRKKSSIGSTGSGDPEKATHE